MEKRLERRECLFYEGVAMVEYDISLPQVEFGGRGDKKINWIFSQIFKGGEIAVKRIYERAIREYDADTDEKKRFRHRPYRYTLSCRITESEGEYFSFTVEASVFLRGKAVSVQKSAKVIRKKDGVIMPFDAIYGKGGRGVRKSLRKSRGIEDFSSFYVMKERIFLLTNVNGRWQSTEIAKSAN